MTGLAGLRIGLVGPQPPPAGGMAMQTRQLAELLRDEKATVLVVATNAAYRPAWIGAWPGVRALFRLLPYLQALWRAAARVDVMHVMANSGWSWHLFAAPAIWMSWLWRVPVIVNYRGGEAAQFLQRSARLVSVTMRRASRLVVPSGFLQEVFGRYELKAEVVPNIVDMERFHPGPTSPARQLIVARNLEPIYDNATALRAFARVRQAVPNVSLLIAGTGPDETMLRSLAGELGIADQVQFAGRLDRDTMAARLRESCIALNPSLADNMPNSILEALASGVPVVSTNVGGVPHIVKDGETALLVQPGDPVGMSAAILRLLREPALAEKLRSEGLRCVAAFTWDRVGHQWSTQYRSVAARGAR